jgi:hypothetical protein
MTSLLLDTQTMLWFFWEDPRLSAQAKALIEDADNRKLVSVARYCRLSVLMASSTSTVSIGCGSEQDRAGRSPPHTRSRP